MGNVANLYSNANLCNLMWKFRNPLLVNIIKCFMYKRAWLRRSLTGSSSSRICSSGGDNLRQHMCSFSYYLMNVVTRNLIVILSSMCHTIRWRTTMYESWPTHQTSG
jgi:hypothetical protein